jgi:hypothetical protein
MSSGPEGSRVEMRRKMGIAYILMGLLFICLSVWICRPPVDGSRSIGLHGQAEGHVGLPALPSGAASGEVRKTGSGRSGLNFSLTFGETGTTFLERVLSQSDPGALSSFESALANLRKGQYAEARETLQELLHSFPKDKTAKLATLAMAVTYYQEGGRENFRKAADSFGEFLLGGDYSPELDDIYQAALIDVAAIELYLVKSASPDLLPEELTESRVGLATLAMVAFLEKWPDSPYAPAAQSALQELLWFASRQ